MANPEDVGILQQGVARWNDWRKTKDGPSLDLSGADLSNRALTGADLRAVNLTNAVLRGTKIGPGSLLWNANLSGADLYGANLRGADLQDVNFSGADLFQADLRESNLQGADLSTAKGGLLSKQLAGADLTGAKLPEPLGKLYDSLSSVKEISDSAQKLFLALLAGCLYSWLTIAQTTDVELITNRATTPLPIIQAAIPIVGFYVVAPLILLCLYFYFHFYLQKLWEELGSLPAVFPDGRLLHNRTDPWLLNDLVRSHFAKLKDGRPFLSYFQAWVSVVLAWWLVTVTLFLFWGRYLRRHDLFWTLFHALILAFSIIAAVRLYRLATRTLRGEKRLAFTWKDAFKRRNIYSGILIPMILASELIVISLGAIFGIPFGEKGSFDGRSPRTWIPLFMDGINYSPFADLRNADVSLKPADWRGKNDEELDYVKGAAIDGANLSYAQGSNAFLVKAQLRRSDLHGADLNFSDLRKSSLEGADLRDAGFIYASMEEVDMSLARLEGAVLIRSRLNGANLNHAFMRHVTLYGATMEHANLEWADLPDANLVASNLAGADLQQSTLTRVSFGGTSIKHANFRHAHDLTKEMVLQCRDWQLAFFDLDMLKQLGLPPDHNEKLQKQMEAEQQAKAAPAAPAAPTAPRPKP